LYCVVLQDNAELKGQVRAAEKQRADLEQDLAAATRAHDEEASRLRRISKKTAEELEEAQQQLKEARERLSTLEMQHQQAAQDLDAATAQLHALQDKGSDADAALSGNSQLKQVRALWEWV
jgi:chromosome segregation ATPase